MKSLIFVWVGLMVLLAATTASSLIPLGAANAILNLVIAIAKTALIALFFMHLRHSIPLLRLIVIVGLFTLSLLFILGGADFITRNIERSVWQVSRAAPTHCAKRIAASDSVLIISRLVS